MWACLEKDEPLRREGRELSSMLRLVNRIKITLGII